MIIKCKPAYKDYIWGGSRLKEAFGKDFPGDVLAESWDLSAHPDGPSVLANGPDAGMTFPEYLDLRGKAVLGKCCEKFEDFPILVKWIDAKQNLSIQVHPDDDYALSHEHQYGKTECWYVADAAPGAGIYYGLKKKTSREEFKKHILDGSLMEILRFVPVKKGEMYFIKAGTLHAITAGSLIVEIQQNSNITYRVYDFGRKGADGKERPLHIEQALDVADLSGEMPVYDFGSHLAECPYFTVDPLELQGSLSLTVGEESFVCLVCTEGTGEIKDESINLPFRQGDCFFIPAGSGRVQLTGNGFMLKTFLND